MERIVLNSSGFSLVEMMIAFVIILISFLALSAVMASAINISLENEMQNTASRLNTQTAETLMSVPYNEISTCGITLDPEAPNYNSSYIYDSNNKCLGVNENSYKQYPYPEQTINTFKKKFNIIWDTKIFNTAIQITITTSYIHNGVSHSTQSVIYRSRV
ncbi:MAG: prepilin-type N-terminal cleavage/methylation domain-containing protein [Nitrospirae bacterium]|nr:prepilin-type N-terminal cleavage/methylation domain-containing protein [Nitrospirota bacterium]